jgi:hypothetical protein
LSITPGPSIKDSPSLWTLVVLVSIWLLVYGFMEITLAFRLPHSSPDSHPHRRRDLTSAT